MKTALITGSTKGIGKQIGIDLLDKGYQVYFIGHTSESVEMLRGELAAYTGVKILQFDLSDSNNILDIVLQLPALDVLVLNAGMTDRTPFGQVGISNWNKVFEMNLTVPFFLIQSLKNQILPNGKIVFVSSISGCTTDSTSIAYGVSKGAIHILVPYLAKEFAENKITVNAIVPGYIDTDWHKEKSKEQIKRITDKCLAKRLGTVKEISKTVLNVIENDFINGQVIRVDGGFQL